MYVHTFNNIVRHIHRDFQQQKVCDIANMFLFSGQVDTRKSNPSIAASGLHYQLAQQSTIDMPTSLWIGQMYVNALPTWFFGNKGEAD